MSETLRKFVSSLRELFSKPEENPLDKMIDIEPEGSVEVDELTLAAARLEIEKEVEA
jgi:hypothetical protein